MTKINRTRPQLLKTPFRGASPSSFSDSSGAPIDLANIEVPVNKAAKVGEIRVVMSSWMCWTLDPRVLSSAALVWQERPSLRKEDP